MRETIGPVVRVTPPCTLLSLIVIAVMLAGCEREPAGRVQRLAEPIDAADACHVCGMIIRNYPGPKGEAYARHSGNRALKFCSTRELFAFILEPDIAPHVQEIFVHDIGATDWNHPADSALIPARTAWYVIDQPLPGAMGPTLAAFANRPDAEAFAARYHGRVVSFDDIDLELLTSLRGASPGGDRGPAQSPAAGAY